MTREELIQAAATEACLLAGDTEAVVAAIEAAGFRIVPVEPDEAMIRNGEAEGGISIPYVWEAMLAASPLAPPTSPEDAR